jgi:hypothetical protein
MRKPRGTVAPQSAFADAWERRIGMKRVVAVVLLAASVTFGLAACESMGDPNQSPPPSSSHY